MIVYIVLNYCILLGLYFFKPYLSLIYITILFIYLIIKKNKKKLLLLVFSLFCFLFSFIQINKPYKEDGNYYGVVLDVSENYYIFSSELKKYYVYEKNCEKEIGDILKLEGNISELSFSFYESNFNFNDYLNNKNIYYKLNVKNEDVLLNSLIKIEKIKKYLLKNFSNESKDFFELLLFSSSTSFSSLASKLGLYSVLSSSGLLLYELLELLKKYIFRFVNWKHRKYIPYVIVFPIIILSSYKIGIIRAFIMSMNKDIFNNKINKNTIYSICLLTCLLFNPLFFKTIEFVLSFILPFCLSYIKYSKNSFKNKRIINSVFIILLYLPFTININNILTIITTLFFAFFKKICAILYSFSYLLIFITFSYLILNPIGEFVLNSFSNINNISFKLYFNEITVLQFFIYYLILFLLLMFYEIKEKKKGDITFLILITYILCISNNLSHNFNSYISFINVSQGDSILIHDKNIDVLIDTGGTIYKDIANDVLIPYLKKKCIKDLDYVFLSHDDYDHNGAFLELCSNFIVKNYVLGSKFDYINVGNLKFENLNHYGNGLLNNDDSSVIKLKFYSTTYLFTGDISKNIEEKLIENEDIKADVLKIAHHGSSSSSSMNFLKKVNPSIAVISVGKNNKYNHPSDLVINRLNKLNIKIYRTDLDGSITFKETYLKQLSSYFIKKKEYL